MKIDIQKLYDDIVLPEYAHVGDSGMDLRAYLIDDWITEINTNPENDFCAFTSPRKHIVVYPGKWHAIPTGLKMAIPEGYEGQIRPRSGLSYAEGLVVLNTPGTLDSSYRGIVKVLALNLSKKEVVINHGDRIAQLVICPVIRCEWNIVNELSGTVRDSGGFGSTGKK